jgi:hypothetical protein
MIATAHGAGRWFTDANNKRSTRMLSKTVMLMSAGALAVGMMAAPANARSLTTDPDATMHEQQKLGPESVTRQTRNGFVTERIGSYLGTDRPAVYGYEPGAGYHARYGWALSRGTAGTRTLVTAGIPATAMSAMDMRPESV